MKPCGFQWFARSFSGSAWLVLLHLPAFLQREMSCQAKRLSSLEQLGWMGHGQVQGQLAVIVADTQYG